MAGSRGPADKPADGGGAADKPLRVRMVTKAVFANPLTNTGREAGAVEHGETIEVDPHYGQDLHLAGLAVPAAQDEFDAALEAAGDRPPVHGAGIRVTRSRV